MKKTLWIMLAVVAFAAIVIVAAPIGIERYAEGWLRDQGVAEPAIENVDFNPFSGVLRIDSLSFSGPAGRRGRFGSVEVNLEWTQLFARRLLFSNVGIMKGEVDIHKLADGSFAVGGLVLPLRTTEVQGAVAEPEGDGRVWGLSLRNCTVEDVSINYRDELLNSHIVLRRMALDSLATWEPEQTSTLAAEFQLDGADIAIQAEAQPFAPTVSVSSEVTIERIPFEPYAAAFESIDISDPKGSLSLDLSTTVRFEHDGAFDIELAGTAEVNDVAVGLPASKVQSERIAWAGSVSATVSSDPDIELIVSGSTDLDVAGLAILHRDKPVHLLSLGELDIDNADISGVNQINVGNVTITSLQLLRSDDAEDAILDIGHSTLENIEFANQSRISIERAVFDTAVASIEREQDGQIKLVSEAINDVTQVRLDEQGESAEKQAEFERTDARPFRFLVGQLEVGGDSRLHFRDTSVAPPLSSQSELKTLRLTEFGNVDPGQSAHIIFELEQEDTASLVGEGDFRLFDEQPTGNVTLSVKHFDLTQLSPYAPGYHVQRGRLSLDSSVNATGDALDVTNTVLLEKLKLSDKAAGDKSWLGEGMAMPLDVALDLLRDSDDRIELDLPISGSIEDLKVGTGDIFRVATQRALQKAAFSYVKNALQPLGSILFVAKIAGKATRPRFEPIQFVAGDAQLAENARAYLDKIATLLSERPRLSITFCGVSAEEDLDYFQAQVIPVPAGGSEENVQLQTFEAERLELAQARGSAIQEYLTVEHEVDVARLFRCRPTIETGGEDGPRVEIVL